MTSCSSEIWFAIRKLSFKSGLKIRKTCVFYDWRAKKTRMNLLTQSKKYEKSWELNNNRLDTKWHLENGISRRVKLAEQLNNAILGERI